MKKILILAAIAIVCVAMGSKPDTADAADKQAAANKKIVTDMFQMLFVDHKVDEAIDKYFEPNYIQHNPIAPDGAETIRTFFKGFYQSTPTATNILKRIICEGDLCAAHSHGIQKPGDRGVAVVDIFRIANGKIAEHWDVIQPVPEKSANTNTMF